MDEKDSIIIKIGSAREQLLPHFPTDVKGDIKLIYRSRVFYLSKAFLRY
jgi:hypothetical protein